MLRVPPTEGPELFADWLEASLIVRGANGRVSDSDLQDALRESNLEEEQWLERILRVVRHRQDVLGDSYPLVREERAFAAAGAWEDYLPYAFLLFVSLNQSYAELRFGATANVPASHFEYVTMTALASFLGAEAIRTGAAREAPVPTAFPAAVKYVADNIGEAMHSDGQLERQNSGDDGLDIWAFKLFKDRRASSLFVLCQCAIGVDWGLKRSELDLKLWQRHIDWFTEPVKAFAVPFQIAQESWRETAVRGGLVLDRLRIAKWARLDSLPQARSERIRTWTSQRIARARRVLAA